MMNSLDESVGKVIESLDNNGMLENSVVLFLSDNGAPADDPLWGYGNYGSNWPLRGVCLIIYLSDVYFLCPLKKKKIYCS